MSSYKKLQDIFKEDSLRLSEQGKSRLDEILGKKKKMNYFVHLVSIFNKIDNFIFTKPKYSNSNRNK